MQAQPFRFLVASAERTPDAIALSTPQVDLTYGELLDSSLRMAELFRAAGVRPGQVVAVSAPPVIELTATFALFHEAAVGTRLPATYLDFGEGVIDWIVTTHALGNFPLAKQILLDANAVEKLSSFDVSTPATQYDSMDSVCYIAFSSGTTGRPKPIPFTIDQLAERCVENVDRWMLARPFMCHLGLSSILGFMAFYAAIVRGDTYVWPGEGTEVVRQLVRHRVRCLVASPHQLGVLMSTIAATRSELPDLAVILSTGSTLPQFLARQISERLGCRLVVAYASSEAGTMALREGTDTEVGFAGVVADGVDLKILDDVGRQLPEGAQGRIAVRRDRQPERYLDAPTESGFHDGFFITGDLGFLRGNRLYLSGRENDMINAAGVKVDPSQVEEAAFDFPGIVDAGACGYSDARGLETVALVFSSHTHIDPAQLSSHLRRRLGESAPRHIARVESVPRNASGKVMRDEVARLFSAGLAMPS